MFCPKCGKAVDERDQFCRFCGNSTAPGSPVQANPAPPATAGQVTVRNPYVGKNTQIVGGLIFVVGLFWMIGSCAAGSSDDSGGSLGMSALVTITGLVVYIIGRFQHWYHAE